jgi:hypothetical protein
MRMIASCDGDDGWLGRAVRAVRLCMLQEGTVSEDSCEHISQAQRMSCELTYSFWKHCSKSSRDQMTMQCANMVIAGMVIESGVSVEDDEW